MQATRILRTLSAYRLPARELPLAWCRSTPSSRARPPVSALQPGRGFASSRQAQTPSTAPPASPTEPLLHQTDSIFQALADQFLALPPELHLSYTSAIILITVGLRLTLLLPLAQWARARQKRREEVVLPELTRFKAELFQKAKKGDELRGVPRENILRYLESLQSSIKAESKRLHREHRCTTSGTILGTLGVSVPILIVFSQTLRTACATVTPALPPSLLTLDGPLALHPLFRELSVFSGESMVMQDLTMALVFGAALMINGEVSYALREARRRFIESASPAPSTIDEAATAQVQAKTGGPGGQKKEDRIQVKGKESPIRTLARLWTPENVRILVGATSVFMTGIASMQPAALTLYWLANTLCTSAQSLFFNVLDRRRDASLATSPPVAGGSPPPASTASAVAKTLARRQASGAKGKQRR